MIFDITIGEIVLVKLSKSLVLCQFQRVLGSQIVCIYGNKSIRIRETNIVTGTRYIPKSDCELQTFKNDCEGLVEKIDIEAIWNLVDGQSESFALKDLVNLYFSEPHSPKEIAAMAILLNKDKYYFKFSKNRYFPNSQSQVLKIKEFHHQTMENKKVISNLLSAMLKNTMPAKLDNSQEAFLNHLKKYAVHGEDYKNKDAIKPFLPMLKISNKPNQQKIFDMLVSTKVFGINEPIELHKIGEISRPCDNWVLDIESKSRELLHANRLNLLKTEAITVDDENTKERDDAFSISTTATGFEVGIHISDPASLINPNTILDISARKNGSSIYLPEKTIPMLPNEFINKFGSLDLSKPRPGLSLIINTSLNYKIEQWRFVPSIITATKSLSYEQASQALKENTNCHHDTLLHLRNFSEKQRRLREQNGAVNFQTQEMDIRVSSETQIQVKVLNNRLDSRVLVSEIMILFNSLAAEFFSENKIPALYRHQPCPSQYNQADNDNLYQASRNEISKNHYLVHNLPQTKLTVESLPHYSLGVRSYIQISSPLRRYADMLLQRQIIHFLTYNKYLYSQEEIEHFVFSTFSRIKDIKLVERQREKYWFMKYLENRIKNCESSKHPITYQAIVLETNSSGGKSLVQIIEFGFKQRINLPSSYKIGDQITLKLIDVNTWHRTARFHIASGLFS